TTPGGANAGAGALPLSGVLFGSPGQSLGVNVITPSASVLCTTVGNCTAAITGFLAGNGTDISNQGPNPIGEAPPYIGLNYTFGNSSTPQVSGAAAFGRDLPLIQVAAATYVDAGGVDQLANVTLPSRANGTTEGSLGTPTGLAVQQLNFDLNSSSVN